MKLDETVRYARSHEWVRREGAEYTVGISDHAQAKLGDIVFVDLPAVGAHFAAGTAFGVIESVKAANDLYLPLAGTVVAVNTELSAEPALVNQDCYGTGWLIRIKPDESAAYDSLLDPAAYRALAAD